MSTPDLDERGIDERGIVWCACKRNGVAHVWEPGEWCNPVRVIPLGASPR